MTKSLLQHWFEEVWNKGQAHAIDALMAPDAIAHGIYDANGAEIRGPTAFKGYFHQFRESFPDIQVTIHDTITDGDREVVRCTVNGTHQGASLGVAASGKRVTFTGICIIRHNDGKIVEAWNNFDFLGMYQQLGLQVPTA